MYESRVERSQIHVQSKSQMFNLNLRAHVLEEKTEKFNPQQA